MGEAKRKAAARARMMSRTWATGAIEVVANNAHCFNWTGSRQEAVDLQKRYLDAVNALSPHGAQSHARRAAGYLIAFGMPKAGDKDLRPSSFGQAWSDGEVELYKAAILWLALREHIPNTGQKLEDVFVGKAIVVAFNGDKDLVLESTLRELRGEPFLAGDKFQMMVGVLNESHRLDPRAAISISTAELFALAGGQLPPEDRMANEPVYLPRIPVDAAEAKAMLDMMTVFLDIINTPNAGPRTFCGYTNEELSGGKPHVLVR